MSNDTEHRVHALLRQIPERGLEAVKALFLDRAQLRPRQRAPAHPHLAPKPCTACLPRNRCSWPVTQAPWAPSTSSPSV